MTTTTHHPAKVAGLTVLSVVVGLGLILGLWFGGWALAHAVRNRSNKLNRDSYEFQTTYAQATVADIANIKVLDTQITADPNNQALTAQRAAQVHVLCSDASNVQDKGTMFDAATQAFVGSNC